jgi:hypothetical protein
MTTLIAFSPNPNAAPPFQAIVTLDGASVIMTATWNVAGNRWYLTLTDQAGNLLWSGALVGSPLTANIYLASDVFQISTILYRADTGNFEIVP